MAHGAETRAVRPGEELDSVKLGAFLAQHGFSGAIAVEQFPGGHSNLTYLVRVGATELVLRRPPHGAAAKGGHDMPREFHILEALTTTTVPVPKPIALCEDASVLGAPFYVMERLRGTILRTSGLADMRALSERFVDVLAAIHAARSPAIEALARGDGYAARQVRGWIERYAKARTDDIADMATVATWLEAHVPADSAQTLIHNDFKYDNLVLDAADPTRIIGVLDWEMATVGDPLLDLGTSLGYWTDPNDVPELRGLGLSVTTAPGNLSRAHVAARYEAVSGRAVGDMVFPYAMALFKIATIAQQIYARFARGLTTDERFARLGMAVRVLAAQGCRAIAKSRIDDLTS